MANRHIKVINGRKYYYESIRKGKKVTSKYLGPVEPKLRKDSAAEPEMKTQEEEREDEKAIMPDEEESYIG